MRTRVPRRRRRRAPASSRPAGAGVRTAARAAERDPIRMIGARSAERIASRSSGRAIRREAEAVRRRAACRRCHMNKAMLVPIVLLVAGCERKAAPRPPRVRLPAVALEEAVCCGQRRALHDAGRAGDVLPGAHRLRAIRGADLDGGRRQAEAVPAVHHRPVIAVSAVSARRTDEREPEAPAGGERSQLELSPGLLPRS